MNFLTRDEILNLVEEHELIVPFPSNDEEGPIIEDIKYPLRFSGTHKERDEEGRVYENTGDNVEIPPNDYRILETEESINLYNFSSNSPVHAMGFIFLPHTFVSKGLFPTFQGIADSGFNGDSLSIVIHNGNDDRKMILDEGKRIAYIMFQYIDATKSLDSEYISNIASPEQTIREKEDVSDIEDEVSNLKDKMESIQEEIDGLYHEFGD